MTRKAQESISVAEYRRLAGVGPVVHVPPYKRKPAAQRGNSDRALGRLEAGRMNKTEARYADHLELLRRAGEIRSFDFEAVNLRLARRTFYRPDFIVWMADGSIEFRETKGFMREDAAIKLKIAAEKFPMFRFLVIRPIAGRKGMWTAKDVRDGI